MFKKVLCLVVCLGFIFSGKTYASDGKFKLEIKYESSSQKAKLVKKALFVVDKNSDYYSQMELVNSKINEAVTRTYLQASYSHLSWLAVSGVLGVGRTGTEINDVNFLRTAGYSIDYKHSWEERGDSVDGRGEMSFLYGLGVEITFFQKKDSKLSLEGRYVYQEQGSNSIILFEESMYGSGWFSLTSWHRKVEIEKVKSHEVEVGILFSRKVGRAIFSGGPRALFAKTIYEGIASGESLFIHFLYPGFGQRGEIRIQDRFHEEEFEFTTKNKNLFAGFARVDYILTNGVSAFAEIMAGARSRLSAGLSFNF